MFSANTSQVAAGAGAVNYIEDVFSTYLYTGNGSDQTITNGIDLSTKGGMVWVKSRSNAKNHCLVDTVRGVSRALASNTTDAQDFSSGYYVNAFSTTGFGVGAVGDVGGSGVTFGTWSFAKAPKFFDVVTYTGDGQNDRQVPHNLGSTPGCVIVKCLNFTGGGGPQNWSVYHRSISPSQSLFLNTTAAAAANDGLFGTPTSTYFVVNQPGGGNTLNANGDQYVAYVFAHNAGGFGLTGTDNVISCGSFTGGYPKTIELGYEPQWLLVKNTTTAGTDWYVVDIMRGMSQTGTQFLKPNTSGAEVSFGQAFFKPTATGFTVEGGLFSDASTVIYIAIRRGPMKVPTSGTSVFSPIARTGTGATATVTGTGFPIDLLFSQGRSAGYGNVAWDRLRGISPYLGTFNTSSEANSANSILSYDMDGITVGADTGSFQVNQSTKNYIYWNFRRAPSFFDEVCYTGNATARTLNHNLTVVPELIIVRNRSTGNIWATYAAPIGQRVLQLNSNAASFSSTYWNSTDPTSTVFSVGTSTPVNASGVTFVAYLFATCAGVSKVGSYTGNGTTQTINCGFTGGARFVLIKNNAAGDWYVYDTARGMTVLTDPYLLLNSTAAETATLGSVTTVSTGFALNAAVLADINTNGDTYIFLAIA